MEKIEKSKKEEFSQKNVTKNEKDNHSKQTNTQNKFNNQPNVSTNKNPQQKTNIENNKVNNTKNVHGANMYNTSKSNMENNGNSKNQQKQTNNNKNEYQGKKQENNTQKAHQESSQPMKNNQQMNRNNAGNKNYQKKQKNYSNKKQDNRNNKYESKNKEQFHSTLESKKQSINEKEISQTKKTSTEQRDTTGDTKVFKIVKKETIENEKRIQAIKNENNENKKTNQNEKNDSANTTETRLNNYEQKNKLKKVKKGKKTFLIILLIILILLLMLLIASSIFGIINKNSNKIIKGVYINNIEVSNLTQEEAIEKINNELNNDEKKYVIVKHNEYEKEIKLNNIEGNFNVEECVNLAYNLGRSNNIILDNSKTIETMISNTNISATLSYNEELLENVINEIAIELPDVATDSSYVVDNGKVIIKNSKDGIQIKTDEFKQSLIKFLETGEKNLEIPVEQVERKEIDIDKIHEEVYKEPKNAYYTKNPFKIYKEEEGIDFAISIDQAKQMLQEYKDEYEIPLKSVKPQITVADLGDEAYPDRLSTFTTQYGTGDVNRNTNIAIAARSINSKVLMPGEVFSYNDLIGECSTRTGYRESTIYMNGQLSTGIGGGICQVSTTLYNAVLRANLEIVDRKNHSLGVTYVPAGHDAMVSIGSQDFKFKNNREYPIKVVAFVGTGSITCQIFGVKQDPEYEVKLASTTIENTATRYKVQTYKILYLDGKEVSRTLLSTDTYKRH